jgi:hypothetical protein
MTLLLSLLLFVGPSHATDFGEAEHIRLSEDLEQLASRQLWPGVEKKFLELQKLGVEMTYEDLLHGAWAARALGNTQAAYDRLKMAAKIKGTREVVDWLFTIDANYGLVELLASPPRGVSLEVPEMPFDPDQRICVETAMDHVKKEGTFKGLLPKGNYTFAGQNFTVQPGLAVRIEVSPRLKKTNGEIVNVTTSPVDSIATPAPSPGEQDGAPTP